VKRQYPIFASFILGVYLRVSVEVLQKKTSFYLLYFGGLDLPGMQLSPKRLTFICFTGILILFLLLDGYDAKKAAPAKKQKAPPAKPKAPVLKKAAATKKEVKKPEPKKVAVKKVEKKAEVKKPANVTFKIEASSGAKKLCINACPVGYKANSECHCVLQDHVGRKCDKIKRCGEGYLPNDQCECVPIVYDPIEQCKKTCPAPLILDERRCLCTCQSFCSGNFEVDPITCKCVCNVQCRFDLILNNATCNCEALHCKKGFVPREGRCVTEVKMACPKGELLINHECVEVQHCPPGYKRRPNRVCEKRCRRGIGAGDKKLCGPSMCGPNKYVINGICKHVVETSCPERSFFDYMKPHCPTTCKEPVALSACKETWSGPGCSCFAGFVYHNGHCIHPNDCPNKQFCIRHGDVGFLLDGSPSIGRRNFDLMKTFVISLLQQMNLHDGNCHRVLVATFHAKIDKVLDLDSYKDFKKHEMLNRVMKMKFHGANSHLGEVLREFRTVHFTLERGLRDRVPRVLVLLTDGSSSNGILNANHQARLVREAGIQLVIIKLGRFASDETERIDRLKEMTGEDSVFSLHGYHDIRKVGSRSISFRCNEFNCPSPRTIRGPCKGEFSYSDRVEFVQGEFFCQRRLVKNVEKHRCKCPPAQVKVSACVKDFKLVNRTVFELNEKTEQCVPKVTQETMRCACAPVQVKPGNCSGIFREIVTIKETLKERADGKTFCQQSRSVVKEVCGCPKQQLKTGPCFNDTRHANVTTYRYLRRKKTCISTTRQVLLKCECPASTVSTRTCTDDNIEVQLVVPRLTLENVCVNETYVGVEPCKRICPKKMDVGIIIDTSSSVTEEMFTEIKDFVKSLVEKLQISFDGIRVSLMAYSSNRTVHMIGTFLTYARPAPLQDRIDAMKLAKGKANIGEAMRTYRKVGILPSQGNRRNESVPQILYLITDGDTKGQVNATLESNKLKALDVQIVVISVGRDLNFTEASQLVSHPAEHNMIQVNTSDLEENVQQIADLRCFMWKNINDITIREEYNRRLSNKKREILDVTLDEMGGDDFKRLERVDPNNLAQVYWTFHGSQYFLNNRRPEKLYNILKKALSIQTRAKIFQIINLKLAMGEIKNRTRIQLQLSTRFADRLGDLVKAKKFKVLDVKKRVIQYDTNITIISAETIAAIGAADELDTHTRNAFKVLKMYVQNDSLLEGMVRRLHKIDDIYMTLRKTLRQDEEAALKLSYKALGECLKVVRDCEAALQQIDDETNRETALGHMEGTLKESIDLTLKAMRKAKKAQARFILRRRRAKAAKGKSS
jgi:hypothetical protein